MSRAERRRQLNAMRKLWQGLAMADLNPAATAFHESGHAVVSTIFGWQVDYVTITPSFHDGQSFLGYTARDRVRFISPLLSFCLAEILAGSLAEARYSGKEIMMPTSDAFDIQTVFDRSNYSPEQRQRVGRNGWILADGLVRHSSVWRAIRGVATLLIEHKTVNGQAVSDALDAQQLPRVPPEIMQEMNRLDSSCGHDAAMEVAHRYCESLARLLSELDTAASIRRFEELP
jgi:hypothetical protein